MGYDQTKRIIPADEYSENGRYGVVHQTQPRHGDDAVVEFYPVLIDEDVISEIREEHSDRDEETDGKFDFPGQSALLMGDIILGHNVIETTDLHDRLVISEGEDCPAPKDGWQSDELKSRAVSITPPNSHLYALWSALDYRQGSLVSVREAECYALDKELDVTREMLGWHLNFSRSTAKTHMLSVREKIDPEYLSEKREKLSQTEDFSQYV